MRIALFILAGCISLVAVASAEAAEPQAKSENILFSESFEDAGLATRNWYDGTKFRIAGDAVAGNGCIEYEWTDSQSGVKGSSPVRRLLLGTEYRLAADESMGAMLGACERAQSRS
jgi:hypothetical protein